MNCMWKDIFVPRQYTLKYLGLNIMMSATNF